jgi:short-subunit dehydrogenase
MSGVTSVNFQGVVHGVRAFLPILLGQSSGVIVNTSSVFGLVGMPYQSAYCASKFAVRGFTDSLRHELRGTGVRAVTVHPGGVKTNIVRNARYHGDPRGTDMSQDDAARLFDTIALTTPERAAKIIHRGVKAGKSRILVGPDAYMFDALARLAPTHYYEILARLEPAAARAASSRP